MGLCLLFAALLLPLPAWPTRWGQELENAAHAPAFAAVAAGAWLFFQPAAAATKALRPFVLAALTAVLLALLTELLQPLTGRDASLQDVWTDLLGATAALAAIGAWRVRGASAARLSLVLLALGVAGFALWPLGESLRAYWHRQALAPRLFDPRDAAGRHFLQRRAVRLIADPDGGWRITPTRSPWPGLTVDEVLPDWSAYRTLAIELRNPGEQPLTLLLRIDDAFEHRRYSDRYNASIRVAAHQSSTWRIPLTMLSHRTAGRNLDLTHMRRVILYQDSADTLDPYVLLDLRLER